MARGKWYRFGYACVNFGPPISMRDHANARGFDRNSLSEERWREEVQVLGDQLMEAVGKVIPVLPVALVATVFLGVHDQLGGQRVAAGPRPATQGLVDPLTPRELQVLELLIDQRSYSEIAAGLFVSRNTVKSHASHIYTKLGVSSRSAAAEAARELGLV